MNIAININKKFINQAKVMLYSLAKYSNEVFNVYILHHELDAMDISSIKLSLDSHWSNRFNLINCRVRQSEFAKYFLTESRWPATVFYRLLVPFIVSDEVDRVLYLDCDMVVVSDITDFYNTPFNHNYIICAEDNEANESKEPNKRLGLSMEHIYVNSGMILFNINEIKKNYQKDQLFELISSVQKKLFFPDQDVLNIMYAPKIGVVSSTKYNFICIPKRYENVNHHEVVIYHFGGDKEYKPWNKIYIGDYLSIYWNIASEVLGHREYESFQKGRWFWKVYGYIYHTCKFYGRKIKAWIKSL